ncbi:MAG TPA: phenylalanine--tRNA ligase subunit alpha [Dehalococcoidia bacterium]|nr:phenylalanine--tRNA ligase subunit alpha [Dehalococcoidia bacterium]
MLAQLEEIEKNAIQELAAADSEEAAEAWRVAYLGRRGLLTQVLRSIPSLLAEERREVGTRANRLKDVLEQALAEKRREVQERDLAETVAKARLDATLPGRPRPRGRLHPVTQVLREVLRCFEGMGFQVAEGPEVEWDYYNFEALRIPKDHPARDMWATLWIDFRRGDEMPMLLRTHTSPVQVRVLEARKPPIRVVVPGKCYRYEATDATHEWMLTQVEGLAVDEGITMADLKGTLYEFAKRLFGTERRVRFRCDYFPFVEPGADMAIDCFLCGGQGCRTCGGSGWIEILGAGMVHPEILTNVGYDAERYTGFAFGMGVERIAMLRHGIDDIRLFYANDLRFLEQF